MAYRNSRKKLTSLLASMSVLLPLANAGSTASAMDWRAYIPKWLGGGNPNPPPPIVPDQSQKVALGGEQVDKNLLFIKNNKLYRKASAADADEQATEVQSNIAGYQAVMDDQSIARRNNDDPTPDPANVKYTWNGEKLIKTVNGHQSEVADRTSPEYINQVFIKGFKQSNIVVVNIGNGERKYYKVSADAAGAPTGAPVEVLPGTQGYELVAEYQNFLNNPNDYANNPIWGRILRYGLPAVASGALGFLAGHYFGNNGNVDEYEDEDETPASLLTETQNEQRNEKK